MEPSITKASRLVGNSSTSTALPLEQDFAQRHSYTIAEKNEFWGFLSEIKPIALAAGAHLLHHLQPLYTRISTLPAGAEFSSKWRAVAKQILEREIALERDLKRSHDEHLKDLWDDVQMRFTAELERKRNTHAATEQA